MNMTKYVKQGYHPNALIFNSIKEIKLGGIPSFKIDLGKQTSQIASFRRVYNKMSKE